MSEPIRDRIIRLIREMNNRTVDRGCTPGEAAAFSAKVAEWVEKYQIEEAELRSGEATADELEVCENILRTGKKVFNPGTTQVVAALAKGMCCEVILLYQEEEAVYGITGDPLDADYVCQVAVTVVPALRFTAEMEGREHGFERGKLISWGNDFLAGAAAEIRNRLEAKRKERADKKEGEVLAARISAVGQRALVVVTGESLAVAKREAAAQAFKQKYPHLTTKRSNLKLDPTAFGRGKEAGKRVGLSIGIEVKG